jgi:hypothetical protein
MQNYKFSKFSLFYHLNSHKIFLYFFLLTFGLQIFFWQKTESIKPQFDLIPNAPNKYLIKAFGDDEFLFRTLGARLQNSGDVFAGFVSLKNYDYQKIYHWLILLDSLNNKSRFTPALASYYYGQINDSEKIKYIIKYLDEYASRNIDENWWWMFQAIYLSKNTLKDKNLALKFAYKLADNQGDKAPLWTKEMPAFLHAENGEDCMAFVIIEKIIKENETGKRKIKAEEMNFLRYFINERLSKLKVKKFDPNQCKK